MTGVLELLGLAAHVHAAKLPAWLLRLEIATELLQDATDAGDVAAALAGVADVWFWQGRVMGDLLSLPDDPRYDGLAQRAAVAALEAREALAEAVELIVG